MSLSFPESYDELAVLKHYGATEEELARRLAEREEMDQVERFRVDQLARSHQGPTLDDHRTRWDAEERPSGLSVVRPPEADEPEVPDGTIPDVLDWVGADRGRAQSALDDEQARPKPRATLVDALQKIVEADGG